MIYIASLASDKSSVWVILLTRLGAKWCSCPDRDFLKGLDFIENKCDYASNIRSIKDFEKLCNKPFKVLCYARNKEELVDKYPELFL